MTRILAVARNTFREAVRNKILYSLLFFAALLILSSLALGELSVHEEARMTRDVGLFGIDLFSVLIAVFVGVNLLYQELERKTVYTILPKPIARWEFVVGKWLGVQGTMLVQIVAMGLVLFGAMFFQGGAGALTLPLASALWLLVMNTTVVTSLALFFSAFSSPFLSGFFTLGLFVLGRSVPDLRLLAAKSEGGLGALIEGASWLLPNLHLFAPSGHAVDGHTVTVHGTFVGGPYLAWTSLYALGYSLLALLAAVAVFRRRDFV